MYIFLNLCKYLTHNTSTYTTVTTAFAKKSIVCFFQGCYCSVTKLCLTLLDPMDYDTTEILLSSTISQSLFKSVFIELVTLSNHSVLCHPLSFCLQSFPASGSFPMSQLLASHGQSIGTSALVLPMNIQGWFPLGLTGLISLQSKGLSKVFSSTRVRKHQFFGTLPSLWSSSHIHT